MSETGPTTVGSIVAKLKLDRGQWVAEMQATKADARELGNLDPTIHINDNAAAVIGRMNATAAAVDNVSARTDKLSVAQGRLKTAMSAADTAYARANVAQLRLNELREKGVTGGSRLASAELTLSEALKRLDSENEKVTASEVALASAQKAAAVAADEQTASTTKANQANSTAASRVGMIAAAVALILPLLPAVGAAAVGVGGALAGMGAAGVLGLIGIHREMTAGTAIGVAYKSGLTTLNGALDTLSHTAAVNMLASFQQVVATTTGSLPFLNTQVGQFATLLGRSGANAATGVINALRVMNPLFQTAGLYLESLTAGFLRWTQGSGIEKFTAYALGALPQVIDVLGKLSAMVIHILEALAPLGTVGLAVLGGISDTINAIPVQILSDLIVSITWGAVAFKAWGFIAPMLAAVASSMGAVGAATTIATGPIGWVVAGLAALAGIFAVVMASNTGATKAMQEYTAAVQADNGAIGENVRATAVKKLTDDGALTAAKQLGLALPVVTEATLGNADALKQLSIYSRAAHMDQGALKQIMGETGLSAQAALDASRALTNGVKDEGVEIAGSVGEYKLRTEAMQGATGATLDQTRANEAVAAALGISVGSLTAAQAAQKDMSGATQTATAQMYLQNDAAGLLKQSLDILNGKTLSAEQAQNQFESQIVGMNTHINAQTKAIDDSTVSLDGMSASAVANRRELIDLVGSAEQSAQAFRDQGGSSEDTKAKLEAMKQTIIDNAVAHGENRDQVQAYIDKIFQIPAAIPPTKAEFEAQQALDRVQQLKDALAGVQRNIDISVNLYGAQNLATTAGQKLAFAGGGTVPGLASGGSGGTVLGRGTAGDDNAGLFRLGHGEEVISNRFGQADRNRAQLKAINAGYTPSIGTGGASGPVAMQPQPIEVHQHFNVSVMKSEDPQVVAMIVGRGARDALAGVRL